MKTIFAGLLAVAPLVVLGCGGNKSGGFSMPPMPVEISRAAVQKVQDRFEAVGSIEASEAITVVTEIDGTVTGLPFSEGTFLKKGDLIAQIDDAQLAAEMSRAEALESQSHSNYDRVKAVVDQKAGSPQDLDDAAAALKVADANLALAKAKLSKTRITAPFDGLIGARRVSVGTFLRAAQPIAELANIDEIRVSFSTPERFLAHLSRGAEVTVSSPSFPGFESKGKIIAIEPVLNASTRSATVVARVPNPGRRFRPGMSANISAVMSERANAVTIPNEAVFAMGSQSFVYVVKPDSTATRTAVTLGTRLPDVVEVLKGVEAGQTVVRTGHQKLFEGAKVMPMEMKK